MIIERDTLFYTERMNDSAFIIFTLTGSNLHFRNVGDARKWIRAWRADANNAPSDCYIVRVKLTDAYHNEASRRRNAVRDRAIKTSKAKQAARSGNYADLEPYGA